MQLTKQVINWVKKETVLTIAIILAILSMFFVTPDQQYLKYIDVKTLVILFCFMAVIAGMTQIGVFAWLAGGMLERVKNIRQLLFLLVMLCFFFSMLITNDVALITFVPLTLVILQTQDKKIKEKWLVPTVVLQTVAANMGSMLTPIGNPQNLYLYGQSNMSCLKFMGIMLPYTVLAFLLLIVLIFIISRKSKDVLRVDSSDKGKPIEKKKLVLYLALCIPLFLTVLRCLDYRILFVIVLLLVGGFDRKIFARVDYSLLFTFVAFFIFIGNMGRMTAFSSLLSRVIEGREVMTGVFASQIMSNVPAALLLSGFTSDYKALMIGTNLGGLGTLIASMASLISYKLVVRENPFIKGKYMVTFTVVNVLFLGVMMLIP